MVGWGGGGRGEGGHAKMATNLPFRKHARKKRVRILPGKAFHDTDDQIDAQTDFSPKNQNCFVTGINFAKRAF